MNLAAGAFAQFVLSGSENVVAASTDIYLRAEFEETLSSGLAEAGSAAGDEDALALQQIVLEHWFVLRSP